MMRFLGRWAGKTEVAKGEIKEKIGTTIDNSKQKWTNFKDTSSEKFDAAADKFSRTANNVAHPIDYAKKNYEEERQRVIMDAERRKIEEKFARELDSERRRMQTNVNNRNKTMAAASMVAPEAAPILNVVNEQKNNKDDAKFKKKEEQLMDKEKKEMDKSSGDNRKFMNRIDDLRQGGNGGSKFLEKGPGILVILSIMAYFADLFTNFARPPEYPVIVLYGLMIIAALVMTKIARKTQWLDSDFVGFFGVIAFTIVFPWVIHSFRDMIPYQWIVDLLGLFLLFPPVFIYLLSKYPDNTFAHKLYTWVIAAILIYAFIQLLASPTMQGYRGEITIQKPMDIIEGLFKNVAKAASGVATNFERSFQMAIARATGQQYQGEEEEQRGILIDSVEAVEKNYYTSSDIYVQGNIRAQNLVGEVNVRTRCYVKDKAIGVTYPEVLTMVNNDENIIDCHLGQLPKGNYQVFVSATFIFVTDADIQYYFVDEKTRPELYTKMQIPSKSTATYTGGPVEIGLPSLNQPLRLSADEGNTKVGNYPFGVSLTNKWTQGKVDRGINYTLEVPAGFELKNCTRRQVSSGTGTQPGRTAYVFNTEDQNIKETFDSVTCRMHAVNPQLIFGGDVVAIKTFNARAVYEYTIEGSTSINVQQDFYGG
jgi:hypothetical protein